jgi:tyrosine-protein kinase Etk/Wzc
MTDHESPTTSHQSPLLSQSPVTDQGDELSLLDLLIVLAKHKRLVLGLPLAAAVLAAGISFLMPDIYTGTTRILPPQQPQSAAAAMLGQLGGAAALAAPAIGLKNPADLYVGMLKSQTIANSLVNKFELQKLYGTDSITETREKLADVTSLQAGKDGIITIDVEDEDPKRAAALANAYVDELDRLIQGIAVTEAGQRRLFLEKQLKLAKDSLADAEVALKQTQEETGLISLDEQGKTIIEAVATLRAQIAGKEVQLAAMRSFATERNPDYVRVQQELAGLRLELTKLEKSTGVHQGDILVPTGRVPESGLAYVRRLRDVKYQETLFEVLAKQYEIARADEAKESGIVQVVDRAVVPDRKSKPKHAIITLVSAFVAALLGVFIAFLLEAWERARLDPGQTRRLELLRDYLLRRR